MVRSCTSLISDVSETKIGVPHKGHLIAKQITVENELNFTFYKKPFIFNTRLSFSCANITQLFRVV